jgi:hypothetical protein
LTSKPPVAGFVVLVNNSLRASPKARAKFTEGATIGHQYATLEGGEKRVSDHQTEYPWPASGIDQGGCTTGLQRPFPDRERNPGWQMLNWKQ